MFCLLLFVSYLTGCASQAPVVSAEPVPTANVAAETGPSASPATSPITSPIASVFRDGKYRNGKDLQAPGFGKTIAIIGRYLTQKRVDRRPLRPLPMEPLTREKLEALPDDDLYLVKLGHSSMLLKFSGKYWLLDPVFSLRASPVSFAGPERFQPTPIKLADLPPIEKVLISHDHYDHLDKVVITYLAAAGAEFLVPMGVDRKLQKWGVDKAKVLSFDWWQELQAGAANVAFTPAQHFSGRGITDRNKTLWGSWVIKTPRYNLFFSGDSGYFDGFRQIGERYGPFDLTFMENGAYNADWPDNHMLPIETVQAHLDLRGKVLMPVHNTTFDLSFHTWYDPLQRITAEALKQQVTLTTPYYGQIVTPADPPVTEAWWQQR